MIAFPGYRVEHIDALPVRTALALSEQAARLQRRTLRDGVLAVHADPKTLLGMIDE